MHSKTLLIVLIGILLLRGFSVFHVVETCNAAGTTFYVGGAGPSNYTSIQSAIT
ncbi:unnamed protein product, partial [marine sediment metagenome]